MTFFESFIVTLIDFGVKISEFWIHEKYSVFRFRWFSSRFFSGFSEMTQNVTHNLIYIDELIDKPWIFKRDLL